jgi:hypothetical protein
VRQAIIFFRYSHHGLHGFTVDFIRQVALRQRIGISAQTIHGKIVLNEGVVDEGQHLAMLRKFFIEGFHGTLAQSPVRIMEQ